MKARPGGTPLSLWPEEWLQQSTTTGLSAIIWSYSRRNTLEQCPRRYYYEYYGGRARSSDPRQPEILFLKSLQNRYERIGAIAHLAIRTYFRQVRSGKTWSQDGLSAWALGLFKRDVAHSLEVGNGAASVSGKSLRAVLQEYYYNVPDTVSLCLEAEQRLDRALSAFCLSTRFAEFRMAGTTPTALIEHSLNLRALPCRVGGKLDLAFKAEQGIAVVDWKLGDPQIGEDSLQLAAYALWASEYYAAAPEAITIHKAHLAADTIITHPVTAHLLANARVRILQDVERLATLHDYGRRGTTAAFTPQAAPAICALCPFRRVCPEGSAVLDA